MAARWPNARRWRKYKPRPKTQSANATREHCAPHLMQFHLFGNDIRFYRFIHSAQQLQPSCVSAPQNGCFRPRHYPDCATCMRQWQHVAPHLSWKRSGNINMCKTAGSSENTVTSTNSARISSTTPPRPNLNIATVNAAWQRSEEERKSHFRLPLAGVHIQHWFRGTWGFTRNMVDSFRSPMPTANTTEFVHATNRFRRAVLT